MRLMNLGLGTLGVLLACCGGAIEEDPPNDGGGGTSGTGGNGTGASPTTRGGSPGEPNKPTLGDCVAGTPRSKAASCVWFAKDLCYSTKEAACNCICPTDAAEVFCMSDFPESGIPTEVYCF